MEINFDITEDGIGLLMTGGKLGIAINNGADVIWLRRASLLSKLDTTTSLEQVRQVEPGKKLYSEQ